MGSHAYGKIGCYIQLPEKGIKTIIKVHGCTNPECLVHKNKSQLKQDSKFCSTCGTATGKIEKTVMQQLNAREINMPKELISSFEGLHIYEEGKMKGLEIDYRNAAKAINLTNAQAELEAFSKKYDYFIEKLQNEYDKSIVPVYGVIIEWF